MSLQEIQNSIESCAATALEIRDELMYQGLGEVAEDALTLRDRLGEIAREVADLRPAVLTDEGWVPDSERVFPREVVRVLDEAEEQGLLTSDESPFDHEAYLGYYNISSYLSRAEFSDATGIAPSVLIRLERGETRKPHLKTVKRLAKALKVHPSQLDTRFDGGS